MRLRFKRLHLNFKSLLENPLRVFILTILALSFQLLNTGSLVRMAKLVRDKERITHELAQVKKEISVIELRIKESKETRFLEREAKNRLDMAADDELVFIFASN